MLVELVKESVLGRMREALTNACEGELENSKDDDDERRMRHREFELTERIEKIKKLI